MKTVRRVRDRSYGKEGIFGTLTVDGTDFKCVTVERPWMDNEPNISCIPEGTYPLKLEYSVRFQRKLFELKNVPNRSEVKIHNANFASQLNGCIALGSDIMRFKNNRNVHGVVSSVDTLTHFMSIMGKDLDAQIIITREENFENFGLERV